MRRGRRGYLRATPVLVLLELTFSIQAQAGGAPVTVVGEGSGGLNRSGQFSAQLPNGLKCSATFSGGKLSLLGHSQVTTTASCTNGPKTETAEASVDRWPNGLPRRATLTFDDGSNVIVVIPLKSSHIEHSVAAPKPPNPWTK